jgi:Fe2+ or Zn2+ uptake regulation protein
MPRRLKLTPEQNQILRLLEEAGEETLGTILNTLKIAPASGGALPMSAVQALEGLAELALVECANCEAGLSTDAAFFDSEAAAWQTQLLPSGKPLKVLITSAGQQALVT